MPSPKEKRLMTPDELEEFVKIAAGLGISKVKITGGEPLLRTDILDIVNRISPYLDDVSLTTNAVKLAPLAGPLKAAGLDRVNISLHTINPETYKKICGTDDLAEVLAGLEAATAAGLQPIKVNMVLLKGVNDDELPEMLRFVSEKGVILQIIEFVTEKERLNSGLYKQYHKDLTALQEQFHRIGRVIGANSLHNREKFLLDKLPDGEELAKPVIAELVMPMHNSLFCSNCTRIRLTAGGYVKGCLFNKTNVIDVLEPLGNGADTHKLEELLKKVIENRKPYWTTADQAVVLKDELGGEIVD
jgi:cyclic pyranopterin phosphate synthase